jgi:uncharacterized protein YciI
MTDDEKAVWAEHFGRLQRLLADGQLILAGPTLGRINTGVAVFEAPDEDAPRQIMAADPAISRGTPGVSCARSGFRCSAAVTDARGDRAGCLERGPAGRRPGRAAADQPLTSGPEWRCRKSRVRWLKASTFS